MKRENNMTKMATVCGGLNPNMVKALPKKILTLGCPHIESNEEWARLIVDLKIEGREDYPLFFQVEKEYESYFAPELLDGPLVCILLWAMEHEYDIVCEAPVSERLYHQLVDYLIPVISKNIPRYHSIQIQAQKANYHFGGTAVGTGLSCGVDSFYAALKSLKNPVGSPLRITHLAFFNAGATGMFGGDTARELFQKRGIRFQKVAEKMGCRFLTCDSNMNEFLMQEHEMTHVYRTLSIPLVLQKGFSLYYLASSCSVENFRFTDYDPGYYTAFLLPMLSNDNLRFEEVGGETTRMGKVEYISQFQVPQEELNTCIGGVTNCHECRKCRRTMLNLFLANQLDNFGAVYDVEWFKKHKRKMFRWAIMNAWRLDMPEIVKQLRQKRHTNIFDYIGAFFVAPFYYFGQVVGKIKFKMSAKKLKKQ